MLRWAEIGAVIFDMDGLVLDTEKTYRTAWREAGRVLQHDFPEPFLDALSGLSMEAVLGMIAAFCGPGFDPGEFKRLSAVCWRDHVAAHGIEVKPGFYLLRDYLDRQRIPFGLATNSASGNAEECLRLAGLDGVFKTMVARDHVEHGKPAPDIFLQAAARLGVAIERCLVLEDSPVGIEAAAGAGAVPVMAPSALPVDAETLARCRLVLNDLAELLDVMRG